MDYGAIVTDWIVPDAQGKAIDIALGFDTLDGYSRATLTLAPMREGSHRIAKARFTLDGKEYKLAANNGPNALHGGLKGFDKVMWKANPSQEKPSVTFTYRSPDGEEGYPEIWMCDYLHSGNDNGLKIDYKATTDKATPINLATIATSILTDMAQVTFLGTPWNLRQANTPRWMTP